MGSTVFDVLPQGYAFVLLLVVLIGFHCLLTGFNVGMVRKKLFTKEFFEKHFPELKSELGRVADGMFTCESSL